MATAYPMAEVSGLAHLQAFSKEISEAITLALVQRARVDSARTDSDAEVAVEGLDCALSRVDYNVLLLQGALSSLRRVP